MHCDPRLYPVVVTQMTLSFELMNQLRHIAGNLVRQPLLHFGQRKSLLDQEYVERLVESVKTRWTCGISHGYRGSVKGQRSSKQ
jgi:hypothetical protein